MAARFNLGQFLTGVMGQHPARVSAFLESLDDATAARLMAAAEAGDNRTVLKAMADQTWGMSKPKATPAPEPTGSRSPMPFEDRVSRDPNIRATINEAGIPPALRAGVEAGDPNAIMEAYRGAVGRGGSTEDSIRALAKPADQVAAESIAGQFDRVMGFDNPPPARQMELPLADEPTGLIPYGVRGPGVPTGGPSAPGVPFNPGTDLIPAPPRRVGGQTRALATQEPTSLRPYRVVDEVKPKVNRGAKVAAAVAAGAAGAGAAYWATQNQKDVGSGAAADENAVQSGGEADLVEESRPAPKVAATEATPEPKVAQAPVDYSLQARALINRLNDMRRAAGGEVPEAPKMMAEINRLIALGNEQRRNPQYSHPQADPARDPYQQARELIAQVNQMYQRGMTPNSPEVQRIMARVRQLQAQGDAIRNRRAG